MFRCDYHIHTAHSPDCCTPMEQQLLRAAELGLNEICITDHMDLGMRNWNGVETAFARCSDELELLRQRSGLPVVKFGAEAGVTCGEDDFLRLRSVLAEGGFDFVIASAHAIGDTDPFEPDFYRGMDFPAACRLYLEQLYTALLRLDVSCYSCVGHVDFPVKGWLRLGAESAELRYEYAPDALDAIFRLAIESGKCIEINTSPFPLLRGRWPELGWLRRYAELGGEFVTIGSDSHLPEQTGQGFELACELALDAGIRYIAVYDAMVPRMIPIQGT